MHASKTIQNTNFKCSSKLPMFVCAMRLIIIGALLTINPTNSFAQPQSDSTVQLESELESPLSYNSKDSIVMDMPNQKARLYNEAHIDYGEIILDACYIEFDFETKEVFARLCIDSTGKKVGIAELTDGDTKTAADSLRFNFESKRGITYQVKLKEGESYIHGAKVKRQGNGNIHIDTALYTTCDLDHPHYYFKLRKAIIKPNDKIISGPVNLFIADVPTPLGLPFGYFPNKTKGANGIVIPTYGESTLGFYLLGGGYYHKFKNDKLATQILGDIYSKGSWGVKNITTYKNKYKYNGNLNLSFREVRQGDPEFIDFSKTSEFFIRWTHNQDAKSKPGKTFSASINAGTSTNFQNDFNNVNPNDYLSNNFNSNISWGSKVNLFKGKIPSNLSINARHNQNNSTNNITFTLPEVTYNINRFYPFKFINSKNAIESGLKKELNKIGLNYNTTLKNELSMKDSDVSLNNLKTFPDSMRNGMRHNVNASTSFKFLNKTVTFNPSYQLTSLFYLDQIQKNWNPLLTKETTDTIQKFSAPYWHSFNASLTTKAYAFYRFANFLTGVKETKFRHTITPNINYSYRPDINYMNNYQRESISSTEEIEYSPFQNGIFGRPATGSSNRISFNLINAIEMKQKNLNDTTGENPFNRFKILENITFNSSYDFNKDSLKLDNIRMSGRTTLYKNLSLRFGGNIDPYDYSNGTKRNVYQYNVNGKLGTIKNVNLALNLRFKSKKGHKGAYTSKKGTETDLDMININPDAYLDFSVPWTIAFNYKIDRNRLISEGTDTIVLTQTISINGDLSLSENWKIEFGTNYDFTRKQFSYSSINITRNLHCWEASFNWIPFGFMKSYNIQINVKSSLLQDLKLQRRRTWYDSGVR